MTLPAILGLVGCAALLIGLLGGGIKAKELEVPKIPPWTRLVSVLLGVVLIGVSLWLFLGEVPKPGGQPTPTPVVTEPAATQTALAEDHAPVLKSVTIREKKVKNDRVIYQDVAYTDPDGNAEVIDWTLVSSSKPGETISDGTVTDSVAAQQQGAVFTGTWTCTGGDYTATIRVALIDKAGNVSNPLEYEITCR